MMRTHRNDTMHSKERPSSFNTGESVVLLGAVETIISAYLGQLRHCQ